MNFYRDCGEGHLPICIAFSNEVQRLMSYHFGNASIAMKKPLCSSRSSQVSEPIKERFDEDEKLTMICDCPQVITVCQTK